MMSSEKNTYDPANGSDGESSEMHLRDRVEWLVGSSDLAGRIRAMDWAQTPLGPREAWPQSLRTIVNLVVGSRIPMVVMWGTELTILYNDSCREIYAQNHPSILGRPARELWPDAWHLAQPMAMATLHRGESSFREEVKFPLLRHGRVEDAYFNIADSPIRIEDGSIGGILVTLQETTRAVGQKQAEKALQAGEETYSAIFDKAPFALALSSLPEMTFTSVNDAFLRLFESTREAIIGTNGRDLNFATVAERKAIRLEFRTNGSVRDFKCTHLTKSGYLRHISLNVNLVHIGGKPHVLTTIQDIAALKEAEEAKRLYQKTKELDELKTRFFANVSHEFRTPLALILGPAEQSLQNTAIPESIRRNLTVIMRNARTVLGYVNNLLDVAKLDAGRIKIEAAAIDMVLLVWLVGSHFDSFAAENKVSFEIDTPTRLVATIDPEKVQRILLNILSNAFKFTPTGGRIRMALKGTLTHVQIEIADSGPGIASERREKIFERFATADPGATGLGLSIAREFALMHEGTITLADAPEGGALFVVELPRKVQPDTARKFDSNAKFKAVKDFEPQGVVVERPTRLTAPATAPLVLVVEDNAAMNAFIADCLGDQYRIETAFDGVEGLQKAKALIPDAILCDLMMPNMTGEELVHEVRRHSALDSTPIVVLSSKHDDEVRVQSLKDGAQDYLTKPFGIDELRVRIGNLVAKRIAENAMRLAEAKFRGIVATSADAIVTIGEGNSIVEWNQGAEKIFGYSRAEIIGQSMDILIPARLRSAHDTHLVRFAGERGIARKIVAMNPLGVRKSGEEFPVSTTISRLDVGGHRLMTAAIRDVSEEKRAENELQIRADFGTALASLDYETTLQTLVQVAVRSLADFALLFLVDENGLARPVASASRDVAMAWCSDVMLNVPVEPSTTHPIWRILAAKKPLLQEMTPENYESLVQGHEPLLALRASAPQSGVGIPFIVNGRNLGVLMLASVSRKYDKRDLLVMEEVGRQCALFIENARLHHAEKAATRTREEVLGIVAHDLRNPLSVILLEAAMLATLDESVDESTQQIGTVIEISAQRMSRIIRDLLDLVRMDAGALSIDPRFQAPERIIAAAIETQKPLLSQGALDVRLECAPALPRVWMDQDRFLQVLENLIGNAIKFSRPGKTIVVGAKQKDDTVVFSVQDQGVGIADADIPHVFERFWAGNTRAGSGAGLGLTIVKKIVDAHGGRVWVESVMGVGSTFYFAMPAERAECRTVDAECRTVDAECRTVDA